jgi:hypothetical protein
MELATWLSVLVLGPGSIAIFAWFLLDVKRIFHRDVPSSTDVIADRADEE